MLQHLKVGQKLAVLPDPKPVPPSGSIEITRIGRIGIGYIQLADGRLFSRADGRCLSGKFGSRIVAITESDTGKSCRDSSCSDRSACIELDRVCAAAWPRVPTSDRN